MRIEKKDLLTKMNETNKTKLDPELEVLQESISVLCVQLLNIKEENNKLRERIRAGTIHVQNAKMREISQ